MPPLISEGMWPQSLEANQLELGSRQKIHGVFVERCVFLERKPRSESVIDPNSAPL
jgi:hypothetical protein